MRLKVSHVNKEKYFSNLAVSHRNKGNTSKIMLVGQMSLKLNYLDTRHVRQNPSTVLKEKNLMTDVNPKV